MSPARPSITVQQGLAPDQHMEAAKLYDEAFGAKLGVAIRNHQARQAFLVANLQPAFAFTAVTKTSSNMHQLVGLAGFHTAVGSFTGGSLSGEANFNYLRNQLGWVRGAWAAIILSLYERQPKPGELLMDGIVVHSVYRGQGIGGMLLDALADYARHNGYATIRLDVIDTNPRARQLYERKGFTAVSHEQFPYLRGLLGFGGTTSMTRQTIA